MVVRFENGALGVIDNTRRAGYGFECAAELVGTRSTLRIGSATTASGVERLTASGALTRLPADHVERHRAAYLEEMRHFVACVRSGHPAGRGRRGGARGADALACRRAVRRVALVTGGTSGIGASRAPRRSRRLGGTW